MAKSADMLSPGQKAPRAGTYAVVGARGGKTDRTATAKRGAKLPPTPQKGQKYVFVEKKKAAAKPKPKAKPEAKAKKKPAKKK